MTATDHVAGGGRRTAALPEGEEPLSEETPNPEPMGAITQEFILRQLQETAAWLDPPNARIYHYMHVDRWIRAVDLTATLMLEHGDFQRRRRGGRRSHAAAVHTRLDGVNAVQLTA